MVLALYRYSSLTLSTNKQAAGACMQAGILTGNSVAGIRQARRQVGQIGKSTGRQTDRLSGRQSIG
jgi:hypothetical protein